MLLQKNTIVKVVAIFKDYIIMGKNSPKKQRKKTADAVEKDVNPK